MKSFYISLLVFIVMLASCRTEYIPVEMVRYDSVYFAKLQKDSIYIKDSVYIKEKNDTVFVDKYKYIYKYVNLTDTVYINRTDSIQVPVEKKLSRWEKTRQQIGTLCTWAIFAIAIYLLIRWLGRKYKRN